MIFRLASPEDFDAMLPMLERFHAENGMAELDIEELQENVVSCASRNMVLLAEDETGPIGGIALLQPKWFYSKRTFLVDMFWYVVPEHRGKPEPGRPFGSIGKVMSDWAKEIGKALDPPALVFVRRLNARKMRGRVSSIEGFVPAGYVTLLTKREPDD